MNYKFKTKPYAHQITALEKSWNKAHFAYFMEMGTGKSKVLIDNIAMLYDQGKIDGVIFFIDPLDVHPHQVDVHMLLRICNVYNIPLATNYKTAVYVINGLETKLNKK